MERSLLSRLIQGLKDILLYKPPATAGRFVLSESADETQANPIGQPPRELAGKVQELRSLIGLAKRLETLLGKAEKALAPSAGEPELKTLANELAVLKRQYEEVAPVLLSYNADIEDETRTISAILEENIAAIQRIYRMPDNKDVIIRYFTIAGEQPKRCALISLDGLTSKDAVNLAVLQPLMLFSHTSPSPAEADLLKILTQDYLPSAQTNIVAVFRELMDGVNRGDTALFVDGIAEAVIIDTKGFQHRSPSTPRIEQSVRGSQAAFSEGLRINTGLVRTLLPTSDLVTEIIQVGDRVPMNCAVMYLKSLANPDLVAELKRRLEGISTDYIIDAGVLEQFIEDHPAIPFPQTMSTERPDRTAVHLLEGRVAFILDGTPFAHLVPTTFFSFFQTIEDFSLKPPAGAFLRLLRLFGTMLAVLLPPAFVAISYFHQEALPTDLALAISGARERVPFPTIIEVLMMEVSFELIREAGLRVPGVLGSTIGIVGAIILGQAAVSANIVSPIMVVLIAINGLASFTIPDYRIALALRMTRFIFLLLGVTMGLVGIAFGLALATALLCHMKSFGVPFMAPIGPKTVPGADQIIRGAVFNQERRPDEFNPQDVRRQPHISRKWIKEKPVGKKDDS